MADNHAVSPVIGVILLVAIVVILVAIFAVFLTGLTPESDLKKVGMNVQPMKTAGNAAQVILYGGEELSELVKLEMIDQGSSNAEYVKVWDKDLGALDVGRPYQAYDVAYPSEDMRMYDTTINVKGTFNDGTETVLLVQPMTFYDVKGRTNEIVDPAKVKIFRTFSGTGKITLEFKWYNTAEKPLHGNIYYREVGTTKWSEPIYAGHTSWCLKGTATGLKSGAKYEVRCSIIMPDGTEIFGDTVILGPTDAKVSVPIQPASYVDRLAFWFGVTASPTPSELTIWYKEVGSNEPPLSKVIKINQTQGGRGNISGLKNNTEYEVWGQIITASGIIVTGNSTFEKTKEYYVTSNNITKRVNESYNYLLNKGTSWIGYDIAGRKPAKASVSYWEKDDLDNTTTYTVSSPASNGFTATFESLKPDTEYEGLVTVTLPDGFVFTGDIYFRTPEPK